MSKAEIKRTFLSILFLMGFLGSQQIYGTNYQGVDGVLKISYFQPFSNRVKDIYCSGWTDYEAEITANFVTNLGYCSDCPIYWGFFSGVNGFSIKGHAEGCHSKTRLELIPVQCGIKCYFPIYCNVTMYLGAGGCYSFLNIHDNNPYVKRHLRKQNFGGIIKSGISYHFCEWGFFNVFIDYLFQEFRFHSTKFITYNYGRPEENYIGGNNVNMSGYKIGLGLGLTF